MSSDAWGALVFGLTCLGALLGFVWRAATTSTSHELRITSLEDDHKNVATMLSTQIDKLNDVIEDLRQNVWRLTTQIKVNDARQGSQGQFADSDQPPKEHRR